MFPPLCLQVGGRKSGRGAWRSPPRGALASAGREPRSPRPKVGRVPAGQRAAGSPLPPGPGGSHRVGAGSGTAPPPRRLLGAVSKETEGSPLLTGAKPRRPGPALPPRGTPPLQGCGVRCGERARPRSVLGSVDAPLWGRPLSRGPASCLCTLFREAALCFGNKLL